MKWEYLVATCDMAGRVHAVDNVKTAIKDLEQLNVDLPELTLDSFGDENWEAVCSLPHHDSKYTRILMKRPKIEVVEA